MRKTDFLCSVAQAKAKLRNDESYQHNDSPYDALQKARQDEARWLSESVNVDELHQNLENMRTNLTKAIDIKEQLLQERSVKEKAYRQLEAMHEHVKSLEARLKQETKLRKDLWEERRMFGDVLRAEGLTDQMHANGSPAEFDRDGTKLLPIWRCPPRSHFLTEDDWLKYRRSGPSGVSKQGRRRDDNGPRQELPRP